MIVFFVGVLADVLEILRCALDDTARALDDIGGRGGDCSPLGLGGQVFTAFFFTTGGFVLGGVAGLHLAEGEVGKDTHQG